MWSPSRSAWLRAGQFGPAVRRYAVSDGFVRMDVGSIPLHSSPALQALWFADIVFDFVPRLNGNIEMTLFLASVNENIEMTLFLASVNENIEMTLFLASVNENIEMTLFLASVNENIDMTHTAVRFNARTKELCEGRGGRPGLPSLWSLWT